MIRQSLLHLFRLAITLTDFTASIKRSGYNFAQQVGINDRNAVMIDSLFILIFDNIHEILTWRSICCQPLTPTLR